MVCAICAMVRSRKTNRRQSRGLMGRGGAVWSHRRAFTLIEMLVAMAITLVMMGAVVTLFANISNSVRNRRATTEMSGQLRHVRNVLQQDLQGATCPGATWQRSEANHGYIEIIEGQYREGYATNLIDADPNSSKSVAWPPTPINPEIDHKVSTLPSSNLPFNDPNWATDAGGLGDADDILMLTVRNEHESFNGRAPTNVRLNATSAATFDVNESTPAWGYESIQSPLAEVVWFAVENPGYTDDPPMADPTANRFFGEPGFRTIYRRTLLIAPWLNPYRYIDPTTGAVTDTFTLPDGGPFKAQPGLLRILLKNIALEDAIAAVVAFQDRYDLSVRLEWDGDIQRWKIVANTLGDLSKRENRFCHFGYRFGPSNSDPPARVYPFPLVSFGRDYSGGTQTVEFVMDPEITPAPNPKAQATAYTQNAGLLSGLVVAYAVDPANYTGVDRKYPVRPFAYLRTKKSNPATAQAMLNEQGQVVRVVHGPMPLWGDRRGQDVMMSDVLAFDLRVYDPAAPMFATRKFPNTPQFDLDIVLTPSDPGWLDAYMGVDNMKADGSGLIGTNNAKNDVVYPYVGQGAYVDMGYGYNSRFSPPDLPPPNYASPAFEASPKPPWFFRPRGLSDVFGNLLAPGYCVYDTWSFHYENDGNNEDGDEVETATGAWKLVAAAPADPGCVASIDEGTNGLDDYGHYYNPVTGSIDTGTRLGIDDVGERETTPPYDKPLRGMQALIRTYEHDSRAIRQVRVNQHFMQE